MTMPGVLATRLWSSRRDLHWNQGDVAERSQISRQYISDLERGRITNPGVEVVEALAAALGVSPSYLLGWSDTPLPGDAAAIGEERVPYTVDPNIQEIIDLYEDLDPANQAAALDIIHTLRRTQNARVVGA